MSILIPNISPCRLCHDVVVVVGLSDSVIFGGMQVEPLMPDRPKVRDVGQTVPTGLTKKILVPVLSMAPNI